MEGERDYGCLIMSGIVAVIGLGVYCGFNYLTRDQESSKEIPSIRYSQPTSQLTTQTSQPTTRESTKSSELED